MPTEKYILVKGPARVSGNLEVHGCKVKSFVVKAGKAFPVKVEPPFEVFGNYTILDGNPFEDWSSIVEKIGECSFQRLLVAGKVDVGKTTFVNFIANHFLPCWVLDADIGQSDIGPPATIASAFLKEKVADISLLKPDFMEFVGSFDITRNIKAFEAALKKVLEKSLSQRKEKVIIDTPGFIEPWFLELEVKVIKPDLVIFIGDGEFPLKNSNDFKLIKLKPLKGIKSKSREERIFLRKSAFINHFENARIVRIQHKIKVINEEKLKLGSLLGIYQNEDFMDIGLVVKEKPLKIKTNASKFNRIKVSDITLKDII